MEVSSVASSGQDTKNASRHSETIADDRVANRQCEEADRGGDQDDVQHRMLLLTPPPVAEIALNVAAS
jgi:hypothetical protein